MKRRGGRRGVVSLRWCPSQRVSCAATPSEGWRPLHLHDRVRNACVPGSRLARGDRVIAAVDLLPERAHRILASKSRLAQERQVITAGGRLSRGFVGRATARTVGPLPSA